MTDHTAQATRAAAAILSEVGYTAGSPRLAYESLVSLLAIAYMQGSITGTHETLAEAEVAFERLRASL